MLSDKCLVLHILVRTDPKQVQRMSINMGVPLVPQLLTFWCNMMSLVRRLGKTVRDNAHQTNLEVCYSHLSSSLLLFISSKHSETLHVVICVVVDSLELIEREYVLVNRPSEGSSDCFDTSLQDSGTRNLLPKNDKGSLEAQRPASGSSYLLTEVQRLTIVHPPTKLQLLHQYAEALAEVAREMVTFQLLVSSVS